VSPHADKLFVSIFRSTKNSFHVTIYIHADFEHDGKSTGLSDGIGKRATLKRKYPGDHKSKSFSLRNKTAAGRFSGMDRRSPIVTGTRFNTWLHDSRNNAGVSSPVVQTHTDVQTKHIGGVSRSCEIILIQALLLTCHLTIVLSPLSYIVSSSYLSFISCVFYRRDMFLS